MLIELALFFSCVGLINPLDIMARDHFGFFYGHEFSDRLIQYETLVLDERNFSSSELEFLKSKGVFIITYISIGETDELMVGDAQGPGGYASWYFDNDGDDMPDRNPDWGSYYVNANSEKWHDYILNSVIASFRPSISGVFLDTVDTSDIYTDTRSGMISLIRKIRNQYPGYFIVQNRGFNLIEDTAGVIDAVLFENFSTYYSFDESSYQKWDGSDLDYNDDIAILLNQIRRTHPIDVWTLEYREPADYDLLSFALTRAERFGFVASTTDIHITRLDLMNIGSIDDETDDLLAGQRDIVKVVVEDTSDRMRYTLILRDDIDLEKTHLQFFIKTSDTIAPQFRWSDAFFADYLIEDDALYRYKGDGDSWLWEYLSDISREAGDNTYEIDFDKILMNIGQNSLVEAIAATQDLDWEYEDQTRIIRLVTCMDRYSTKITPGDSPKTSQVIMEISASLMSSVMKAEMVLKADTKDENHYGFFIDTDALEKGYKYYNITAPYMILDDGLYRYRGDGDTWQWDLVKAITPELSKGALTYSFSFEDVGFDSMSAELIGFVLDSSWTDFCKSPALQVLNRSVGEWLRSPRRIRF